MFRHLLTLPKGESKKCEIKVRDLLPHNTERQAAACRRPIAYLGFFTAPLNMVDPKKSSSVQIKKIVFLIKVMKGFF